jgi:GNAT superfamily N-acetyltransferase
MTYEVIALTLEDIMALRVKVLRKGTPVTHCNYPEDAYEDVVHLGVRHAGIVIGTSSWFRKECPNLVGETAVQLKGMAVDESLQGSGLGAMIISAGVTHARNCGANVVWARARDSALGFYLQCGFAEIGPGYVDEPTGMAHHNVFRRI